MDGVKLHRKFVWGVPRRPWVLHSTELLGVVTERWIETQVDAQREFDARLLGHAVVESAERRPNWVVASDRFSLRLLHAGMLNLGGRGGSLLGRSLRVSPPAAIHAHFGVVAASHRTLARSLGCPLLASFYGYDATMDRFVASAVWLKRYRRLFDDVAAVFVEGPSMAARVAALGCPDEKLRVVRLPADAAGLRDVVRQIPETFLVVAAGRLVGKKGFDTAIRAFAKALRGRDAKLLMVGGGPLADEYRKLARESGISEQVTWLESLPFQEFMSQVAGASVALFPSRQAPDGDAEGGAPVTLIEAQWLGVPALVSDHDDLPFIAAPGGSIVLPSADVDAWADALHSLYENPGQLGSMGDAGALFARANHSPEGNAVAREAIYAELTGHLGDRSRSLAHA
jgi:colanic acid/amylovoran biosynthesis glycosyltransferase